MPNVWSVDMADHGANLAASATFQFIDPIHNYFDASESLIETTFDFPHLIATELVIRDDANPKLVDLLLDYLSLQYVG